MFFHSATVAELFLTIERTTYTIRRVRDTGREPLAAPALEEPAVLFLRRPAGFESDRFSFLNFTSCKLPLIARRRIPHSSSSHVPKCARRFFYCVRFNLTLILSITDTNR